MFWFSLVFSYQGNSLTLECFCQFSSSFLGFFLGLRGVNKSLVSGVVFLLFYQTPRKFSALNVLLFCLRRNTQNVDLPRKQTIDLKMERNADNFGREFLGA